MPDGLPIRGLAARGAQIFAEPLGDIRMLGGDVLLLGDVVLQVMQSDGAGRPTATDALPAPVQQGGLTEAAFMELPIKKFMRGLVTLLGKSRGKTEGV